MSEKPTGLVRCKLSAAVLAVLLLAVGLLLVWPWFSKNRFYAEELMNRTDQLQRLQNIAAQRPRLEAELQKVQQAADQTQYYIQASTPAVGAAELQKLVKRIIDTQGGNLVSTQAMPVKQDGQLLRIAIRVRLGLELDQLAGIMHALEQGRPLLFIEDLSMRYRKPRGRTTRQLVPPKPNLDIFFILTGYMREGIG